MKRLLTLLAGLVLPLCLLAQTTPQEDYLRRYNNLVSRVGAAGLGVEMPIVEMVYRVCYEDFPVRDAMRALMERPTKAE